MVTEQVIAEPLKYVCPVCGRDCPPKFKGCLDCGVDGKAVYAEGPRNTKATIKLADLSKEFKAGAKFIVLTPRTDAAEFEVTLCKTRKEVSGVPCLVIYASKITSGSFQDFRTAYANLPK